MNRERLFSRLGGTVYAALVDATALCRASTHSQVDLDHWALCLLRNEQSDFAMLLELFGSRPAEVRKRLEIALGTHRRSHDGALDLSVALERSIAPALAWSQLAAPSSRIRSGHVLLAWLDDEAARAWLKRILQGGVAVVPVDDVVARYDAQAGEWLEAADNPQRGAVASGDPLNAPADALTRWATCVTDQVARGELDPIVGRDDELRAVIDTLLRRRQNNPILVGEAGVGKSAIVEALAQRIHQQAVPPALERARIWALDVAAMQAGASARGEFEQRLRAVIDAVIASPEPVILFCDETHTLIGAGGPAGTGDAANLIKPMLARGQLRMIGATTWAEYKQHIEPDAAFTRRFQPVAVDEPDDARAVAMLRAVAARFATHHGVRIADEALEAAVVLSRRYLPARQLPDKAVSLLDTACARVAMSQNCDPAELDRLRRDVLALDQTLSWRASDRRMGLVTPGDEAGLAQRREQLGARTVQFEQDVEAQRVRVRAWLAQLDTLDDDAQGAPFAANGQASIVDPSSAWVRPWVDRRAIEEVLSEWARVPVTQFDNDEVRRIVALGAELGERIHGQQGALRDIVQVVQVAHAKLNDPRRPHAVLMFAGPTGTGKSLTASVLAQRLFGGEGNLIQFNMNEFQEAHTVSTLKGAPPGYVGFGKGGRLTEAVRKKPYSVLLLDEFDRAHPDVLEVFYQAFDQGWMEDGEGRRVSFRHCLILLTSNLGDKEIEAACAVNADVSDARLNAIARDRLAARFAPALLARMQVIAFRPLDVNALAGVAAGALDELGGRLAEQGIGWRALPDVAPWMAHALQHHPAGGRAIRDLLQQHVIPAIARGVLDARTAGRSIQNVTIRATDRLDLSFDDDTSPAVGTAPRDMPEKDVTPCV